MRLIGFINHEYLNEIKMDFISSKQFIPESVRNVLTFDEIQASFDESLDLDTVKKKCNLDWKCLQYIFLLIF